MSQDQLQPGNKGLQNIYLAKQRLAGQDNNNGRWMLDYPDFQRPTRCNVVMALGPSAPRRKIYVQS